MTIIDLFCMHAKHEHDLNLFPCFPQELDFFDPYPETSGGLVSSFKGSLSFLILFLSLSKMLFLGPSV